MFAPDDTIVAVATPPGRGGLGVVRISGPDAPAIAGRLLDRRSPLRPRRATFARAVAVAAGMDGRSVSPARFPESPSDRSEQQAPLRPEACAIDHVIATYFPGPRSYTGDDVVEISAHGSPVLLRQIVCAAQQAGARLAQPGEFTLRAFLNGRIDLVQAEAVADLVDAVTPLQARVAFDQLEGTLTGLVRDLHAALFDLAARLEASIDFPEEGYHFVNAEDGARELEAARARVSAVLGSARRGRLIREGRQVAIAGKPNVGKSSIFNWLLQSERAIVTPVAGTTRDLVTDRAELEGIPVTFIDTAGVRTAGDAVEAEGVSRARQAHKTADAVIVVLDRSRPLDEDDRVVLSETAKQDRVVAVNKIDLPPAWPLTELDGVESVIETSVTEADGLDVLRAALVDTLRDVDPLRDAPAISNVRHVELLERADRALARARDAAGRALSEEFVLADLQDALAALEEVTGVRTTDEVLEHIFRNFCIGK